MAQTFYRLDLSPEDYTTLKDTLKESGQEDIIKMIDDAKKLKVSEAKRQAIARARQAKSEQTKAKIVNAIYLLRLEGKPLSMYAIAKTAGVSPNTAKKYQDFIEKRKGTL